MSKYLNKSTVIRRIESRLGLSHHILELSKFDVMETVIQETLPEFSKHFPYMVTIDIDPNDRIPNRKGWYHLKTDLDVIGVSKTVTDGFTSGTMFMSNYFNDPIARQMHANLTSSFQHPILFHYHHPNMLEMHPKDYIHNSIAVELKCIHPDHLMTIPIGHREWFLNLAFYDICLALHPIRFHFSQINTSFGSIELFNQHLETAQDKRDELLEKMKLDSIKASNRRKIYYY